MPTDSYAPVLPPPQASMSLLGWLRVHLFSPWYNTLLTLGLVGGLALAVPPLWHWIFAGALAGGYRQSAAVSGRALSQRPGLAARVTDPAGLAVRRQYGRQPGNDTERQCPIVHWLGAPHLPPDGAGAWYRGWSRVGAASRLRPQVALATPEDCGTLAGSELSVILIVLGGMEDTGLSPVATTQWGGLMTLLLAAVGIVASFPWPGVSARASEHTARDPLVCDCLYRTGAGCASSRC